MFVKKSALQTLKENLNNFFQMIFIIKDRDNNFILYG